MHIPKTNTVSQRRARWAWFNVGLFVLFAIAGPPTAWAQTVRFATTNNFVQEPPSTTNYNITVTIDSPASTTSSIQVTTVNSTTALDGAQYTTNRQTLMWNAGDGSSRTFTVTVTNDVDAQATNKFFYIQFETATGSAAAGPQGTVSIREIEANFSATSYHIPSSANVISIPVVLSAPAPLAGATNTATTLTGGANGNAGTGIDFTPVSTDLVFPGGVVSTQFFNVQILNDDATSPIKSFSVKNNAQVGGIRLGANAIVTNDEVSVTFVSTNFNVAETNSFASVVVTISTTNHNGAKVDVSSYTGGANTAVAGTAPPANFQIVTNTLSWAAGDPSLTKTSNIPIFNDGVLSSPDRFFGVHMSGATITNWSNNPLTGGIITGVDSTVTINDAGPTVSFSAANYNVGETAGTVQATVNISGAPLQTVFVTVQTLNGTAAAGVNYTTNSTTLNWNAGDATSRNVNIPILYDSTYSGADKLFNLVFTSPIGVSPGASATVTINELAVSFQTNNFVVFENGGAVTVQANISGPAPAGGLTALASTFDGAAVSNVNYQAKTLTFTWPAGNATPKTSTVNIFNDGVITPNKVFTVSLLSTTNYTIGTNNPTTVTIIDVPPQAVSFSVTNYNVGETEGNALITVNISVPPSTNSSVTVISLDGTAISNINYVAISNNLSFPEGNATPQTFMIPIIYTSNSVPAIDNFFTLHFTNATNVAVGPDARVTINELTVSWVTNAFFTTESADVLLTAQISGPAPAGGLRVTASPISGTTNGTAVAGVNYVATNLVFNWNVGETQALSTTLGILNDAVFSNPNKFFSVRFNASVSNRVGAASTVTIQEVSVAFQPLNFVTFETTNVARIPVVLSTTNHGGVNVTAQTLNGTALSNVNYIAVQTNLHWNANQANPTNYLDVLILNDLVLSNPNLFFSNHLFNAVITNANGLGNAGINIGADGRTTITDAGPTVSFAAANFTVNETINGVNVTLNISAAPVAAGGASVGVHTIDGTAVAGINYTDTTNTITWNQGDGNPKQFFVPILNDGVFSNPNRVFTNLISSPVGCSITASGLDRATVTIVEVGSGFTFQFLNFRTNEAAGNAQIRIMRLGTTSTFAQVNFSTQPAPAFSDGTSLLMPDSDFAIQGTDYTATAQQVNFAPGVTSQIVNIPIVNDNVVEFNKDVLLELRDTVSGNLLPTNANGAIIISRALLTIEPDFNAESAPGSLNLNFMTETGSNPTPGVNGSVYGVAVQNAPANLAGRVMVVGDFDFIQGTARSRIARLTSAGAIDTGFNPVGGADNFINTLAIQSDGKVVVGGGFHSLNGASRFGIGRYNTNGTLDTAFDPGSGATIGVGSPGTELEFAL